MEMRARLSSLIFLIPSPPSSLGMQMESHDLRVKFLVLLGGKPHQTSVKDGAQIVWKQKSTHCIGGDSGSHGFEENKSASLGKGFGSPSINPI